MTPRAIWGASPWARFRVAFYPAIAPGILASLIIVFTQSIEEFAIAFIVGAPNFTTIPSILYSYLGYNFVRPKRGCGLADPRGAECPFDAGAGAIAQIRQPRPVRCQRLTPPKTNPRETTHA